jgi:tRNA-binding EMAP/Myf-like protein
VPAVAEHVVGTVVSADDHPGARAPSYLLRIDVGGGREVEASVERGSYARDELAGRQVVVALEGDEATVVGAHSHAAGRVLLRPDREVEPGTVVS